MVPIIEKPAVSLTQKRMALFVAGMADFLQIVAFPAFGWGAVSPVEDGLDIIVAVLLMAICGFRWQWILAFAMELMPGLDLLPTWTMVVALMPARSEYYASTDMPEETVEASPVDDSESDRAPVKVRGVVVPPVRKHHLPQGH